MAFPVAPTNGQTAVVNNITYQFSNVGNTWTRILSTANIITANTLVSNGYISAVGNVSGNYILGNGSQLTGISINPSNIASGTSNVTIVSAAAMPQSTLAASQMWQCLPPQVNTSPAC